jgi:hypothetical protein
MASGVSGGSGLFTRSVKEQQTAFAPMAAASGGCKRRATPVTRQLGRGVPHRLRDADDRREGADDPQRRSHVFGFRKATC